MKTPSSPLKGLAWTVSLSFLILTGTLSLALHRWPRYFRGRATDYEIYMHQKSAAGRQLGRRNLVIGDSRGNCHFDPRRFGTPWLNLSLPGGTAMEGFCTLQNFMSHGNEVDTLLVVYGLDFLSHKNLGFFENLGIPHQAITRTQLKELEDVERQWGVLFQKSKSISKPRLRYLQWLRRLRYDNLPLAYQSNFFAGVRDMTVQRRTIDAKSTYVREILPRTRGHMLFGKDSAVSGAKRFDPKGSFTLYPFNRLYLERIFQLTHSSGTKVIMVIPPWNEASLASPHAPRYLDQAQRILGELTAPYPHVRLVMSPASLPNNCFGDDSFHLNERGVDRYTEELRKHVFLQAEATPDLPVESTPDLTGMRR